MANVINETDPRGKNVICTEDCWNKHIVKRHPFIAKNEEYWKNETNNTVKNPDSINKDSEFPDRRNYYRRLAKYYMKVVVSFDSDDGYVKTMFLCSTIKEGESEEWTK